MEAYLLAFNLFLNPPKISNITIQPIMITRTMTEVVATAPEPTPVKPQPEYLPAPIVPVIQPRTYHRTDGYDNMCYRLGDSYTVVVIKDYDPNTLAMFPYLGTIDDTQSASPFDEAVKWCKQNDTQAL